MTRCVSSWQQYFLHFISHPDLCQIRLIRDHSLRCYPLKRCQRPVYYDHGSIGWVCVWAEVESERDGARGRARVEAQSGGSRSKLMLRESFTFILLLSLFKVILYFVHFNINWFLDLYLNFPTNVFQESARNARFLLSVRSLEFNTAHRRWCYFKIVIVISFSIHV